MRAQFLKIGKITKKNRYIRHCIQFLQFRKYCSASYSCATNAIALRYEMFSTLLILTLIDLQKMNGNIDGCFASQLILPQGKRVMSFSVIGMIIHNRSDTSILNLSSYKGHEFTDQITAKYIKISLTHTIMVHCNQIFFKGT